MHQLPRFDRNPACRRSQTSTGQLRAARSRCIAIVAAAAVAIGTFAVPGYAQESPPRLPDQVEPRVQTPLTIEQTAQPPAQGIGTDPQPQVQLAPPGADRVPVDFQGLLIVGGTVYPDAELDRFYADYIGQQIPLARIYQIAAEIQQHYRQDGYLLARVVVPEQTVADGVFTLRIVEGFVAAVRIEGDVGRLQRRIETYLDKVKGLRPVHRRQLDRYLLLINDLPGVVARGILRPTGGELGASELVLRVERDPFDVIAVSNNRGSEFTGPVRVMAVGRSNSVLGSGEGLELLLMSTVGDNEQRYAQFVYGQPLGDSGLNLGLLASYGPTEPGSTLGSLDLETTTKRFRLSMTYPVTRTRERSWFLDGGVEATDSQVELLGQEFSNDKIRTLYVASRWDFAGGRSSTNLRLAVRQGIGAFGATPEHAENVSRVEGEGDFTSLRFYASHLRAAFGASSLYLAAVAQFSADPLLADEEFRIGGEYFGRGYDPAEVAGDSGFALSGEVRYSGATEFGAPTEYQLYGFYDVGRVWNQDTGVERTESLASAGFGLRARIYRRFDVGVELARPLNRPVAAEGNKDPRLFLQFSMRL